MAQFGIPQSGRSGQESCEARRGCSSGGEIAFRAHASACIFMHTSCTGCQPNLVYSERPPNRRALWASQPWTTKSYKHLHTSVTMRSRSAHVCLPGSHNIVAYSGRGLHWGTIATRKLHVAISDKHCITLSIARGRSVALVYTHLCCVPLSSLGAAARPWLPLHTMVGHLLLCGSSVCSLARRDPRA